MFEGQKERSDPVMTSVCHSGICVQDLCIVQGLLALETYNMAYYFVSFLRQGSNHSLGTLKGMQANESFIFIKTREQDSLMYLQDLKRSKDVSLISPQRNSSAFFIQELNCQKVSCLPPDVSYLVVTKE